ncbi:MAG: aldo/keto reductase, partial [Tepidisphaeraceae bacterium]
ELAKPGSKLDAVAHSLNATPAQVALAWLLHKSPVMLPIPGTSKVKHLDQNTAAATLKLDDKTIQDLDQVAKKPA